MNKAKALMQQVHASVKPSTESPPKIYTPPTLETMTEREFGSTPKEQVAKPTSIQINSKARHIPTGVKQIARDDVDINCYGVKPVATNFNCYNQELFDNIRTFSSKNQFNGGVAITKSQLIEVALDFVFYDMGLSPIGFQSAQELREHLQETLRKSK